MAATGVVDEKMKAEIQRLHAEGMAEYRIAARLGIAPNTVRWHLGKRRKPKNKIENLDPTKFIALLRAARGRTDTVANALGAGPDEMIEWLAERVMAR